MRRFKTHIFPEKLFSFVVIEKTSFQKSGKKAACKIQTKVCLFYETFSCI